MRLASLLATLLVAACSPEPPPGDEPFIGPPAEICTSAGQGGALRAAELGVLDAEGAFQPLANGDAMPLILGFQGGYMVTPALRFEAFPEDPATLCCRVELANEHASVEVAPGFHADLRFDRAGDHLQSGFMNDLLAFDPMGLPGTALGISARVRGGNVEASVAVEITLAPP
jgi:hypothetical protein